MFPLLNRWSIGTIVAAIIVPLVVRLLQTVPTLPLTDMSTLPAIRLAATLKPQAAIIFFHGLGDTGDGWLWFPQLARQQLLILNHDTINWVFPHAPKIPITANMNMVMPGWFNIYEFGGSPNSKQDADGFLASVEKIKQLVKEQQDLGISADKIIVGGFSQGAALSLAALALLDVKIGGIVALSGFCPIPDVIKAKSTGVNANTPVFQGHGTADPIVPFALGEAARDLYKGLGYTNYTFKAYPGLAHSADEGELVEVQKFIANIIN